MRIKIEHLSHRFTQDTLILDNINFEDTFSTLALIGPSGGGKSTLLRILGGLITPSKGKIYFNDKPLHNDPKSNREWHKKVGFVFQTNGLFPHLSGIQNITLPLIHVFEMNEKEAHLKACELLERFGLLSDGKKYPRELSGGQQQRISIARAVATNPELLLLDEPTSALDPEYTSEVLDMVDELSNEGLKIIVVTHEMGFARNACEKAMFLYDGNIVEYNDSLKFFGNPQTKELETFLHKILEWKEMD